MNINSISLIVAEASKTNSCVFYSTSAAVKSSWRSTCIIPVWPRTTCPDTKCWLGSTIAYKPNIQKSKRCAPVRDIASLWTCFFQVRQVPKLMSLCNRCLTTIDIIALYTSINPLLIWPLFQLQIAFSWRKSNSEPNWNMSTYKTSKCYRRHLKECKLTR